MFDNWIQGEIARIAIDIDDSADAPVDVPDITIKTLSPNGSLSTHQLSAGGIQQAATGRYFFDLPLSAAGHWYWRWDAGGSAIEGHLSVQPSRFA